MYTINKELAGVFEEMGTLYEFLGQQNRYRAQAYHNAAKVLQDLPEDIREHIHDANFIKRHGIGSSIASKIVEYLETRKIASHLELRKSIPTDLLELLKVPGVVTETLKKLHEELKVSTKEDLIRVLEDGSALKLKGFKDKKIDHILEGLKHASMGQEKALLWDALEISELVCNRLRKIPEVIRAEVAGSVRRREELVVNVDILVAASEKDRTKITQEFLKMEEISKVLSNGETKVSVLIQNFRRPVDLRLVSADEWGPALQYFTGSTAHNIHLRKIGMERGLKVNKYGIFEVNAEKSMAGSSEQEFYKKLGLPFIPPELREDAGEIEMAQENRLYPLIRQEDIRGEMHCHSRWSDGMNSIEEMGFYIKQHFKYEYMVLTDHSKSERIAGGLDEEGFMDQLKEIKKVNRKLGMPLIKAGAEVDILPDGSLDLEDHLLEKLEWVVASIHSNFKMDNTERIIRACENPFVNVIGHPTGRILGGRDGYPIDMERVIEAAAATNTALEINAHANRMDLNDKWARRAAERGVKLVIGTDAHHTGNFAYMKLGAAIAQRAWCHPMHILNTRSWKEIMSFRKKKLDMMLMRK